jgi:hypothetical protein
MTSFGLTFVSSFVAIQKNATFVYLSNDPSLCSSASPQWKYNSRYGGWGRMGVSVRVGFEGVYKAQEKEP